MTYEPEGPDIIEFATSRKYLGKDYLSVPQRATLKAIYGLEMTREERLAFLEMSDGREPRRGGYTEIALIWGRRSGKSDCMGIVATYESVRWGPEIHKYLTAGQVATVILIAQDQKGARIVRGYIEGNLHTLEDRGYEVLAKTQGQERAITGSLVRLRWPVEIAIYTATKAAVRGTTGLCFIGDEIAHWKTDDGAYNQDTEVMRAARPCFATLSRIKPKRMVISSPFEEHGYLWDEYKARHSSKTLVLKAPTETLNPAIEREFYEREEEKDRDAYVREFLAEFAGTGGSNAFLSSDIIEQCIEVGRVMNPPRSGVDYVARIDAAFKTDIFSLGIGHAERKTDGVTAVVDLMKHWTPGKHKALVPEDVVREVVAELRPYGVDVVEGDQYADVPLAHLFEKHGIKLLVVPISVPESTDAYKNLRAGLRGRQVSLPDDPTTIRHLKALVKTQTARGHVHIAARKGRHSHDDAATVVSRLVMKLLPLCNAVDIAKLNEGAMPNTGIRKILDFDPVHQVELDPFGGQSIMEAVW